MPPRPPAEPRRPRPARRSPPMPRAMRPAPELDDATALVAACADCAALHHDLRAIAAALPALPAPPRTRDFRLTARAGRLAPARRLAPPPRPVRGSQVRLRGSPGRRPRHPGPGRVPRRGLSVVPLAATAPTTGARRRRQRAVVDAAAARDGTRPSRRLRSRGDAAGSRTQPRLPLRLDGPCRRTTRGASAGSAAHDRRRPARGWSSRGRPRGRRLPRARRRPDPGPCWRRPSPACVVARRSCVLLRFARPFRGRLRRRPLTPEPAAPIPSSGGGHAAPREPARAPAAPAPDPAGHATHDRLSSPPMPRAMPPDASSRRRPPWSPPARTARPSTTTCGPIAAALPALPAPRRTRDFRLTPAAGRLAPPRRLAPPPRPVRGSQVRLRGAAGLGARHPGPRRVPPRRHRSPARRCPLGAAPAPNRRWRRPGLPPRPADVNSGGSHRRAGTGGPAPAPAPTDASAWCLGRRGWRGPSA